MKRKSIMVVTVVAAIYPVWGWYARRMADGSDDPWGLLALATLAFLIAAARRQPPARPQEADMTPAALGLLIYAASFPFVGHLMHGALGMTAIVLAVSPLYFGRRCHLGLWGLAMLSLPLMASLQFYLGYPLRALVGDIAVALLRFAGYGVMREGAGLLFGEQSVVIDAPCSGIKMLWAGGYLVCVLACHRQLTNSRIVVAGLAGIALVIAGNSIRTVSLFYAEVGSFELPDWGHSAVGVLAFAMTAAAIVASVQRLAAAERQAA